MKIYVVACDKFTHVCPTTVEFLNKNWPNQDITILGYGAVTSLQGLPENVDIHSLGNEEEYDSSWTTALIPFFENVKEDYFALILEDTILMNPVDSERLSILEEQFISGSASKAMIGGGLFLGDSKRHYDSSGRSYLVFNQSIDYRCSLHPAIWKKDYFLKFLKPNMNPWQFELWNNNFAKHDGAKIINNDYKYPEEPHTYSFLNLYQAGKLTINEEGNIRDQQPSGRFFAKEDLKYIWRKINNA
tara:strand:- start:20178 stop:20912 length:735 start_codon:yes stop_codon:yes gene_type:complete